MSFIRRLLCLASAAFVVSASAADEKKEEKKKELPKITMAVPFGIVAGATNSVVIRGLSLSNATEIRFLSTARLTARIKSKGKAAVPDKADPKKLGDTQVEAELALPVDFQPGDLPFTVSTRDGDTATNLLYVIAAELVFDEQEPNAGFRKPNDISLPRIIRGVIQEPNDVDVFRFKGRAGGRILLETKSVRYGSPLDPILTAYDSAGHVLKSNDDADGTDARLSVVLPRDGDYFFSINDAHDRGGPSYTYLVRIELTAPSH